MIQTKRAFKRIGVLLAAIIVLAIAASTVYMAKAADYVPEPRGINYSSDFSVAPGKSFKKNFNTRNLINDDHDSFSVVITETNAPYRVLITSDDGETLYDEELSGRVSIKREGIDPELDYTIMIQNTGTSTLTGHLQISSYYK